MPAASSSEAPPVSGFATALIDLLDRVEYRRVGVEDQFDPVYRLRYEAYRREEFIPVNSQQVVRDEFDDLANAQCFGVYIDDQLVSSLRFHVLSAAHRLSPSQSVYPDIIDPMLDRGMSLLDPGRFTADYEASLKYPALAFLTLRILVMGSWYYGVDLCFSSVRPEHAPFYRRIFRSTQMSDERYYHGLRFPMVLMACDVPTIYPELMQRYPFFNSTIEEREMMFGGGTGPVRAIQPTVRQAQRLAEMAERIAAE
jgi:hypothetical protein